MPKGEWVVDVEQPYNGTAGVYACLEIAVVCRAYVVRFGDEHDSSVQGNQLVENGVVRRFEFEIDVEVKQELV